MGLLGNQPALRHALVLGLTFAVVVGGLVPLGARWTATASNVPQGHAPPRAPAPPAASLTGAASPRSIPPSLRAEPRFAGLAPGAFHLQGSRPASWAGNPLPPGAPIPKNLVTPKDNWSNDGINWSALAKFCYGVWPDEGGQSQYLANCYGHDEPGLNPYSDLPGSGGNVTWNITLPTGRNATEIQSDLYSAIWFGMTLSDPYAWMDECFLELQFYPDSSWGLGGISAGNWVGAAVAWQIEAATGSEDPCFYQQLTVRGTSGTYFNMQQGDQIRVTMLGWVGSPFGENLTIQDLTSGQTSFVNLYNSAYGYPLDPAYATSSYPNSLQWTPGGELPVSFAFETGHANSNYPNANQYGGCSSGPPPASPTNPAVPCPSYDPGSWANDTVTPWQIPPPVFYNAHARQTATQMGFTQDWAGILFIDGLSGGSCNGRDGSAWCSYPWWSFSCRSGGFNFGATDYPGVSADFGKYDEYERPFLTNSASLGYYPPANVSVPTCGQPAYNLTVSANGGGNEGTVRLLSTDGGTRTNVTGLTEGDYSLTAEPASGYRFVNWTVSGGARVDFPSSPWASLNVTGNGTVAARFAPTTPGTVTVRFTDVGSDGWQAVEPGILQGPTGSTRTYGVNGAMTVLPGIYSILAYPKLGYNFTSWSSNNSGGLVAAPGFPFTWLVVTGNASVVDLTVTFSASALNSSLSIAVAAGSASLTLDGQSIGSGTFLASTRVGTYSLVATPGSGYAVQYWSFSGIAVGIDQHAATNFTLEGGTGVIYVWLGLPATVTVATVGGAGNVSIDRLPAVGNQTEVALNEYSSTEYPLYATVPAGLEFVRWTVANSKSLWVLNPVAAVTAIWVNGSSTLTAHYQAAATSAMVEIDLTPSRFNWVSFDGGAWSSVSPLFLNLSPGEYLMGVTAGPAYTASWASSGAVGHGAAGFGFPVGWQILNVGSSAARGWMNGTFTIPGGTYFPVSVVASDASGSVKVDGIARPSGGTLVLTPGPHSLSATFPAPLSFTGFEATSNLSLQVSGFTVQLNVQGSGTVYAISTWPIDLSVAANTTRGRAPLSVGFSVGVIGAKAPWTIDWNFHDGSGIVTGATANHTFLTQGFYNVTTSIVDSLGSQGAATTLIQVLPPALTALASANVTSGIAPLTVNFTGRGFSGVPPYSFNWTFDDGSPAWARPNATHTFVQPGTYYVKFYLNDSARQHSVTTVVVSARSSLTASIAASPLNGTAPLQVKFQGLAHLGTAPYTYAWSFGDGAQASGANVSYIYRVAGLYPVTLLVGDRFGSVANASVEVNVSRLILPLSVAIVESAPNVTVGKPLSLRADVSGGTAPFGYAWSGLPPGCASASGSFTCTPTRAGNYSIGVNVTDSGVPVQRASATVALTVDPASGGGPGPGGNLTHLTSAGGYSWLPYAVVVAALVAGIVAYALVRRRRGPPEDVPPAEELPPEL